MVKAPTVGIRAEDGRIPCALRRSAPSAKRVVRFEAGEGLEKKEENFAEEVARQMGV